MNAIGASSSAADEWPARQPLETTKKKHLRQKHAQKMHRNQSKTSQMPGMIRSEMDQRFLTRKGGKFGLPAARGCGVASPGVGMRTK